MKCATAAVGVVYAAQVQYPPPLYGCTYLIHADDLTVRLLNLPELGQEVPEAALGDNLVRRKDAHAVELWCRVGVRGQVTPNDLVFLQATCWANRISAVLRTGS